LRKLGRDCQEVNELCKCYIARFNLGKLLDVEAKELYEVKISTFETLEVHISRSRESSGEDIKI
jgi:hypothetical protein